MALTLFPFDKWIQIKYNYNHHERIEGAPLPMMAINDTSLSYLHSVPNSHMNPYLHRTSHVYDANATEDVCSLNSLTYFEISEHSGIESIPDCIGK